jgi:hypothetical protein
MGHQILGDYRLRNDRSEIRPGSGDIGNRTYGANPAGEMKSLVFIEVCPSQNHDREENGVGPDCDSQHGYEHGRKSLPFHLQQKHQHHDCRV